MIIYDALFLKLVITNVSMILLAISDFTSSHNYKFYIWKTPLLSIFFSWSTNYVRKITASHETENRSFTTTSILLNHGLDPSFFNQNMTVSQKAYKAINIFHKEVKRLEKLEQSIPIQLLLLLLLNMVRKKHLYVT